MKKYDAYKDSGVKWIGEIPNHWEAIKISRVHPIIGSGTTPLSSREDYYSEKGLNWLQTGDLNNGLITETSKKITPKAVDECKNEVLSYSFCCDCNVWSKQLVKLVYLI